MNRKYLTILLASVITLGCSAFSATPAKADDCTFPIANGKMVNFCLENEINNRFPPPAEAKKFFQRSEELGYTRQIDAAITALNQAIELAPDYAEAYLKRGGLKVVQVLEGEGGFIQEAISDFERATQIYQSRGATGTVVMMQNLLTEVQALELDSGI